MISLSASLKGSAALFSLWGQSESWPHRQGGGQRVAWWVSDGLAVGCFTAAEYKPMSRDASLWHSRAQIQIWWSSKRETSGFSLQPTFGGARRPWPNVFCLPGVSRLICSPDAGRKFALTNQVARKWFYPASAAPNKWSAWISSIWLIGTHPAAVAPHEKRRRMCSKWNKANYSVFWGGGLSVDSCILHYFSVRACSMCVSAAKLLGSPWVRLNVSSSNVFACEAPRSEEMFSSLAVSLRWSETSACYISPVRQFKGPVRGILRAWGTRWTEVPSFNLNCLLMCFGNGKFSGAVISKIHFMSVY